LDSPVNVEHGGPNGFSVLSTLRCCNAERANLGTSGCFHLIPAPAVADMATQVRCSNCGRVFAASELRHTVADRFQRAQVVVWVVAAVFAAWVPWSLLR
jgi:hypothetical protein